MSFNPVGVGLNALDLLNFSLLDFRQIKELQVLRLKHMILHADSHSDVYRNKYRCIDLQAASLADLPITKKEELMKDFDAWVCDPNVHLEELKKFISESSNIGKLYLGKYVVWESSGSGGSPAIFLQDSVAMDVYDALEGIRKSNSRISEHLFDPLFLTDRIALVGAVDGFFASNVSFERARSLRPYATDSLKSISILRPLAEVVDELNQFRPTIIATYPTTAVVLADAALKDALSIPLKEMWIGGETLTHSMKSHIESGFDIKLRNNYGASEFFEIAWECDYGHMHVNADWVILEAVDEAYRPIPDGKRSHTCLLTNLANRIQPIIRYDLGDSIRFHKEKCACGSNLPCIDILGRSDDLIRVVGNDGSLISIMPLALTTAIEEAAGVFEFQIEQKSKDALIVRLPQSQAADEGAMSRAVSVIQEFLKAQGCTTIRLIEEPNSMMKIGKSGKLKRLMA